MAGKIDARLAQLGITLPDAPAPAANYVPAVRSGNLLFVAGQVPVKDGKDQVVGKLGRDVTLEQGQLAARICAVNIIAQVKAALGGDLDRVTRCVRVGGFVNAVPEFADHHHVRVLPEDPAEGLPKAVRV